MDIRGAVVGALQGISGGGWYATSGRVCPGYAPYELSGGSGLLVNSNTGSGGSGALIHVGPGACVDDDEWGGNRHPTFAVDVDAWLAIPKDAANDLTLPVAFVDTMRDTIHGVLSRGGTVFREPQVFNRGSVQVLKYTLSCIARGCDALPETPLLNELDQYIYNEADELIYAQ